jgi:hypothetical protein
MVFSAVAQNPDATGLQFYLRTTQSPELAENTFGQHCTSWIQSS